MMAPAGLGAVVRTSQVGALASPTTTNVIINGVTPQPPVYLVPQDIPGLKLWLDPTNVLTITSNASSNVLGLANRIIGSSTGATAVTSSVYPSYVASAYNSLPAVLFPTGARMGTSLRLTSPSRCYLAVLTTPADAAATNKETPFFGDDTDRGLNMSFCAYDHPNGVEYYIPASFRQTETGGATGNYPRPNYNSTPWMLSIHSTTSTGSGLYFNGNVNRTTLSNTTFATGSYTDYMGSLNTNYNPFTLHEYLIYDANITAGQRQRAEGYLAWKWGIQSTLPANHPFKLNAPV